MVLNGLGEFSYDNSKYKFSRENLFNDLPIVLHVNQETNINIKTSKNCEFAIFECENNFLFENMFFDQNNLIQNEHRGKDVLQDTCYRMVRTIF